jgi:hypothetical protein
VTHLNKTPRNDVTPTAKKLLHHATRFAISQACYRHPLAASIFRSRFPPSLFCAKCGCGLT